MFDRLVEDFCQFDDFCRVLPPLGSPAADGRGGGVKEARATGGAGRERDHDHRGFVSQFAVQELQGVLPGRRPRAAALGLSQSTLLGSLHRFDQPCVGAIDGLSAQSNGAKDRHLLHRQHTTSRVSQSPDRPAQGVCRSG